MVNKTNMKVYRSVLAVFLSVLMMFCTCISAGAAGGDYNASDAETFDSIYQNDATGDEYSGSTYDTASTEDEYSGATYDTPPEGDGIVTEEDYDYNGDGVIDISDCTEMQMYLAGYRIDYEKFPDINNDGVEDINDCTALQIYLLKVSVKNPFTVLPTRLSLNTDYLTICKGDEYQLEMLGDGYFFDYTFTCDHPKAASVDNEGLIKAVSPGISIITLQTENGLTSECTVVVKDEPSKLSLSKSQLTLGAGESCKLLQQNDVDAPIYNFEWTSSNADILEINGTDASGNAEVTAKAQGTAQITLKAYNGLTASCAVTVKGAPGSISLNKTSITLGVGESFELDSTLPDNTASYSIAYSSSNSDVATVTQSGGFVTAKAVGTAAITAQTYNGKKAVCEVTIKKAPDSISLNKTSITLGVGETYDLNSILEDGTAAYNILYSSGNPEVASVKEAGGLVTAAAVGTATISATAYNGKTATCTVTVKKMATSVTLNASSLVLFVGEKYDLNSSIPDNTAAYSRTYSSSNEKVASVEEWGGLVSAKSAGSAVITVAMSNGKKASCNVTVADSSTKKTTTRATILKSEASWASGTVKSVAKGSAVYQYGKSSDGRWIKVKFGSDYGWIYNKALGVSGNYSSINTSTLPVVADDILFDTGTSIRNIFDYVYSINYRNASDDTVENLCVYILVNGRGACYHHAALLYYLLDRAGYEALMVKGIDDYTGGGPHEWCMVKTDGKWRHIDATAIIGLNEFYLVKDSTIAPYFTWDRSKYPAAN